MEPAAILWQGHPSHWRYFGWWVLGLLLALVLVGFFIIWWILVDRARRTYTVAPGRVIVEWGWFVKNSREIRIQDIRSIEVTKRGLTGMLGVGDVEFSSAAREDAEVVFHAIAGVERVRDLVRGQQVA
jgi:uncharacterized membrane protein YdbT with pleckstrin-like domain